MQGSKGGAPGTKTYCQYNIFMPFHPFVIVRPCVPLCWVPELRIEASGFRRQSALPQFRQREFELSMYFSEAVPEACLPCRRLFSTLPCSYWMSQTATSMPAAKYNKTTRFFIEIVVICLNKYEEALEAKNSNEDWLNYAFNTYIYWGLYSKGIFPVL